MRTSNRKGFTLIELLIVVVIIGILAAIAIPKFANTKNKAYVASMRADLKNLVSIQESHYADKAAYTAADAVGYEWTLSKGNAAGDRTGDATGWSATISNPAVDGVTCAIYAGTVANPPAPATREGVPACTGDVDPGAAQQ